MKTANGMYSKTCRFVSDDCRLVITDCRFYEGRYGTLPACSELEAMGNGLSIFSDKSDREG